MSYKDLTNEELLKAYKYLDKALEEAYDIPYDHRNEESWFARIARIAGKKNEWGQELKRRGMEVDTGT